MSSYVSCALIRTVAYMHVIETIRAGGPEVLRLAERPIPEAEAGHVVIRNHAVGVNFADLWRRLAGEPGDVPGIEVAGTVHAVGAGVAGAAYGDRVVGLPYFSLGGYAEYTTVPATHVFPIPKELDFELAAAVPVNYLTAYIAVVRTAQVRAGERVLVHAAAGGVGLAATQLSAAGGAVVIATASPSKHAFLEEQPGVRAVVDYRRPEWEDEVRTVAGGGVDVVVDGVGEDGYRKSLGTLDYGGRLVAYGLTAAMTDASSPSTAEALDIESMTVPFYPLFEKSLSFAGVTGDAPPERLAEWLGDLFARCARGELVPRIDARFPLADAADAHRRLHERRNIGKIVLLV
jgi:NADPH:quinone reductase-like Zn-dependent oxidoreductase